MDGPAWIISHAPAALAWCWRAYWVLIAALTILCFTTTALWLGLWLLGVPVPLPPPVPRPVAPGAGRYGAFTRL